MFCPGRDHIRVQFRFLMYVSIWCFTVLVTHSRVKCRRFPGQRSSSNSLSNARLLMLPLLKCSLVSHCGTWQSGYECTRLFRAAPRSQRSVTVNIAESALIKATEIWKISPCSTFLLLWLWKKDYRGNIWKQPWSSCFWGCFSLPASGDVAATCYRWESVSLWRNGHLQARCST